VLGIFNVDSWFPEGVRISRLRLAGSCNDSEMLISAGSSALEFSPESTSSMAEGDSPIRSSDPRILSWLPELEDSRTSRTSEILELVPLDLGRLFIF